MKCTNKNSRQQRARKRRTRQRIKRIATLLLCAVLAVLLILGVSFLHKKITIRDKYPDLAYEKAHFNQNIYEGDLFAKTLCVTDVDIASGNYQMKNQLSAIGLFDLNNQKVVESSQIFQQIYPASTTKLLTAVMVLKYANLDDMVTVSDSINEMEAEAQRCGLIVGDQISMYDLLCGLLLHSGNDAAIAIAEHMSGSMEAFVQQMNEEAVKIGATGTHFVNDHGLHEDDHYTTAYDLYLMFNECCKDQRFLDIIGMDSYVGTITGADGVVRTQEWTPTNYYSAGIVEQPQNVNVIGGKTGTTDEAGSCVILYSKDSEGNPYISIAMGAEDKQILYDEMTSLLISDIK